MSPRHESAVVAATSLEKLRGETSANAQPAWMTAAIVETGHKDRGTVKVIADGLGKPERAVYPFFDRYDPKPLKAAWIPAIVRATGDFRILDAIEAQLGRVAFSFHLPDALDHSALHTQLTLAVKEFGDVLQVAGTALADGRLDARERDRLVDEIDEQLRVMCQFRAAVLIKAEQDAAA